MRRLPALLFFSCVFAATAPASTITLTGSVTQSTVDGTGPALSNPSLNNITDGEIFTLTLSPATDFTGPGLYVLTGSSLVFVVPAASATEGNFDVITLAVNRNGSFDDFSLLACLTATDCTSGNELTANFRIAAANIDGTAVPVTDLDQPHPLDLLEDDGTTDLHASISTYTNTAQSLLPEPNFLPLCALASLVLTISRRLPGTNSSARRNP